jgi:hypothetical protein
VRCCAVHFFIFLNRQGSMATPGDFGGGSTGPGQVFLGITRAPPSAPGRGCVQGPVRRNPNPQATEHGARGSTRAARVEPSLRPHQNAFWLCQNHHLSIDIPAYLEVRHSFTRSEPPFVLTYLPIRVVLTASISLLPWYGSSANCQRR